MKLEQHLYTSRSTEFATVAVTNGISRDERLRLEEHSLYLLPTALMYQEQVEAPVKYIFYPLGSERVVVGWARYIGKDRLGRPGNYFFHNLVVNTEDFFTYFHCNPAALLRYLERQHVFRTDVPDDVLSVLTLSPSPLRDTFPLPALPSETLTQLISVCLRHQSLQLPILLTGASGECLDFLENVYTLLPYRLRNELSFDTYRYGVNLDFRIQGLPEASEFRQQLSPAFSLHLASGQSQSTVELPEPSPRLAFILEVIASEQITALHVIYDLEYHLEQGHHAQFTTQYRTTSHNLRQRFFELYRSELLEVMIKWQEGELLQLLYEDLTADDLLRLAVSPQIVQQYFAVDEKQSAEHLAEWLSVRQDKAFHSAVLDLLDALPETEYQSLSPLKMALRFELTPKPSLLSELLNANFQVLPASQQTYILRVMIKGIFATKPVETFQQHLRKLVDAVAQQSDALLLLLRTIEETGVPHKATSAMKDAFAAIPQAQRTEEIETCIIRIFTPPPSFFQRLKTRFLNI